MYAIYGNMDPINIPQMLAYIPYMDPMGYINRLFSIANCPTTGKNMASHAHLSDIDLPATRSLGAASAAGRSRDSVLTPTARLPRPRPWMKISGDEMIFNGSMAISGT